MLYSRHSLDNNKLKKRESSLIGWIRKNSLVPLIAKSSDEAFKSNLDIWRKHYPGYALVASGSYLRTPGIFKEELQGLVSATIFLEVDFRERIVGSHFQSPAVH